MLNIAFHSSRVRRRSFSIARPSKALLRHGWSSYTLLRDKTTSAGSTMAKSVPFAAAEELALATFLAAEQTGGRLEERHDYQPAKPLPPPLSAAEIEHFKTEGYVSVDHPTMYGPP